jgi:uncharacterized glyoxalase superfamily protein PhnB
MKPESLIPVLYTKDITASINYYTTVLGFESHWLWEESPTFGGVNWGKIGIFFCQDGQGQPGTWLFITLENVNDYYETIKKRGAKIISPPKDESWSMREMLVEDPDGHIIRFANEIECD